MATQGQRIPTKTRTEILQHYALSQSYLATSKQFDVDHVTVRNIVIENEGEFHRYSQLKKREIIDRFWQFQFKGMDKADEILEHVSDKDDADMLKSIVTSIGIIDDKRTRASGEATERIESKSFQLQINASGAIVAVPASSESD